jgi:hypothetical protein
MCTTFRLFGSADYSKQHCILASLVAQKIGRQTSHESIWHTPKTEDFFSKGIGLFPFPSIKIPYSEDPL